MTASDTHKRWRAVTDQRSRDRGRARLRCALRLLCRGQGKYGSRRVVSGAEKGERHVVEARMEQPLSSLVCTASAGEPNIVALGSAAE